MNISIKGQQYKAEVSELGEFSVVIGDEVYKADTLAGLQKKAQDGMRRRAASVAVPFTKVDENGYLRHGVATGLHARNRTTLVRWDSNGQADQLGSYYGIKVLARLTDEESAAYTALFEARRSADRALKEFEAAHPIDLDKAVRKAVNEAVGHGD